MKRYLIGLFSLCVMNAYSASDVLIADNFIGASNGTSLTEYNLSGQSGILAPLAYTINHAF